MTKLSILIPTYNRRDRLEKTFPGLISNSSKDIEFIIVDNNSKDSTEEFFKKYCKKDSRIKTLLLPFRDGLTISHVL